MYQRQVTFVEAVKKGLLENYCNFQGRASRSEYWWFALFYGIVSCAINCIFGSSKTLLYIFDALLWLGFLLPNLGITVRRLHDVGKSGWWIFISLVPLIGWIWLIVLLATPSQETPNEYGPEPNVVS